MPWMWTEGRIGTITTIEVLDIQQGTIGIEGWETKLRREKDWNMEAMKMTDKVI